MEVTRVESENTHAIVGGGEAREYKINASVEFFEMLSSTIYSNPKLAVVRETLSNCWDAHIMGGATDTPVEVTISDEEIIFRDFGPGISDDEIHDIFCVYGGSTKVKDATQTGGFGVGSKAGYSYTKHFTVISCHKGKRAIYAASRGSRETEGRPDFRSMATGIDTDETGLTVKIPLKSEDMRTFTSYVKSVVLRGGILCKLNGELLERIDYDSVKEPFFIASSSYLKLEGDRLVVRYGSVMYPIDTRIEEINSAYRATEYLHLCGTPGLVTALMADPNSISVAPSRETLSYNERTKAAIVDLIERADAYLKDNAKKTGDMFARRIVRHCTDTTVNSPLDLAHRIARFGKKIFSHQENHKISLRENLKGLLFTGDAVLHVFSELLEIKNIENNIGLYMPGWTRQTLIDEIIRAVRAKNPQLRRIFNSALKTKVKSASNWGFSPRIAFEQMNLKIGKSLLGAIDRLEAHKAKVSFMDVAMYRRGYNQDQFTKISSAGVIGHLQENFSRNAVAGMKVILTPNITAAKKCATENDIKGLFMMIRVLKSTDLQALTADLERMGCVFFDAHPFHEQKKKTQAAPRVFEVYLEDGMLMQRETEIEDAKSEFYVHGAASEDTVDGVFSLALKGSVGPRLMNAKFVEEFGPILVTTTGLTTKNLKKAGKTHILEEIGDRLKSMARDRKKMRSLMNFLPSNLAMFRFGDASDYIAGVFGEIFPDEAFDANPVLTEGDKMIIKSMRNAISYSYTEYGEGFLREAAESISEILEEELPKTKLLLHEVSDMLETVTSRYRFASGGTKMQVNVARTIIETTFIDMNLNPRNPFK